MAVNLLQTQSFKICVFDILYGHKSTKLIVVEVGNLYHNSVYGIPLKAGATVADFIMY
jgi:hypothetical protein